MDWLDVFEFVAQIVVLVVIGYILMDLYLGRRRQRSATSPAKLTSSDSRGEDGGH